MDEREDIRVHRGVEVPLRGGGQGTEAPGCRIVDDDVEGPELLADEADHVFDILFLADVSADAGHASPHRGDLCRHRIGFAAAGDVVDDDVGPCLGQPQGTRPADAPATPGDERHLSVKINHDCGSLGDTVEGWG